MDIWKYTSISVYIYVGSVSLESPDSHRVPDTKGVYIHSRGLLHGCLLGAQKKHRGLDRRTERGLFGGRGLQEVTGCCLGQEESSPLSSDPSFFKAKES